MSPVNAPPDVLEDVEELERVPLAGQLAAGSTHTLLQQAVSNISKLPAPNFVPLRDQPQPGGALPTHAFLGKKEDWTLPEVFDFLPLERGKHRSDSKRTSHGGAGASLVYGSLTALLALLYFGLIVALQSLFQGLFYRNNAVALAVSTLVIAALFRPLRHRIQAIIDRRFYRRRYDAAQVVARFSETLRQEVDQDQLCAQLLAVVQQTMLPSDLSLWVRPSNRYTDRVKAQDRPRDRSR